MSGRQDELVPPAHMDELYIRCSSEVKAIELIKDGMHNDTCAKVRAGVRYSIVTSRVATEISFCPFTGRLL